MNGFIRNWFRHFDRPCFFDEPLPDGLEDVHCYIVEALRGETTTVTIDLDERFLAELEEKLRKIGWTVNEALVLYLMWSIRQKEEGAT